MGKIQLAVNLMLINFFSVSLSDYVPNFKLIPVNAPYVIETFCKYP